MADQIPRLVIPLGPPTQPHEGTIRLSGAVALLQLDQPARLETRAERRQAEGLPRRPGWEQPAEKFDQGDMALCGKVALRGGAHAPGQRQGATCLDAMAHQRGTPTASAAALHDEPHRLQGELTQPDIRLGQQVHLLQAVGVVDPPRQAFDTAFGYGAVGHCRGDGRQLGALAAHDAADERSQGEQVLSDRA